MHASELLTGRALPPGTLCLTYDDGPGETVGDGTGPRTLALAGYLADEGVRATFFMTGRHVEQMPAAPAAVRGLGHPSATTRTRTRTSRSWSPAVPVRSPRSRRRTD